MKFGLMVCLLLFGSALLSPACGSERKESGQTPATTRPYSQKMFVKRHGDELYISAKMGVGSDITYWFKRCMFNELYTFYRVGMSENSNAAPTTTPEAQPDVVLNLAYSDNIGPLAITGHGWCGGNHKYLEQSARTAFNQSYTVTVDNLDLHGDSEVWAERITVTVENVILDPSRPYTATDGADELRDALCRESVIYHIYRNNIEVTVRHRFCNQTPLTIALYYGMQSMFEGESDTFTPAGACDNWSGQSSVSSFTKGDYPHFRRFIEKNEVAFQSSFLLADGLGSHDELGADDVVFIGNSHGKSYHKLIADKKVVSGDETHWHGVYTWFASPIIDDSELLCYEGVVDGRAALFIDSKGACERGLTIPSYIDTGRYEVIDSYGRITVSTDKQNNLRISADNTSGCVVILGD